MGAGGRIRSGSGSEISEWSQSTDRGSGSVSGCVGEGRKPLVLAGPKDAPSGVTAFSGRAGTIASGRAGSPGGRARSIRGERPPSGADQGGRRMDRRDSIHSVHGRCIYGFGPVGTVPSHARAQAAVQRSARRESSGGVERPAAVPAGGSSTGGLPGMPRRTCPAGRLGAPVRRTPGGRSLGQLPFRVLGSTAVENTAATPNETPAPQWLPSLETDACGRVGRS